MTDFDRDDVLERLGLESRRSGIERVMPALAVFGAGVLVGVGIGMIFAPRPGAELRGELQSGLRRAQQKVKEQMAEMSGDGEHIPGSTQTPLRTT